MDLNYIIKFHSVMTIQEHWGMEKNFNQTWPKLKMLNFDEKFKRLWNYYLDYCETGFSLDHTDVTQFFLKKLINEQNICN